MREFQHEHKSIDECLHDGSQPIEETGEIRGKPIDDGLGRSADGKLSCVNQSKPNYPSVVYRISGKSLPAGWPGNSCSIGILRPA